MHCNPSKILLQASKDRLNVLGCVDLYENRKQTNKQKETITYYKFFFKGIQIIIFGSLLEFDHVSQVGKTYQNSAMRKGNCI